ncbi:cytochrome P450 monooxygenase 14 [Heterobasidion irregulare TC 32-1]|uniref:Cytochrome P450 monooxygenase 14 n=1 Tax=Heterobasidion irregulare (strain TC 32-1) TaxID=747525 RepID=W4K9M1_HETIT|nr:cytochrome P450 monooxygenase 14 [Heterobasidion irregulare TC 32-1]ETW82537.1 cytochrome P450 monooxygenase 14 [Heterobasidion irregulare TC 32-1]
MPSSLDRLDIAVCAAVLVAITIIYLNQRRNRYPYPPGPKGLPILGNILDIPEQRQWITYARWGRESGSPIIRLNVLGTTIIVINDLKTAVDLFEKRGDLYSNRPRMPMVNEALGFDWDIGFTEDMERWKICRREFTIRFRQIASRNYRDHELAVTHELLNKLLLSPNDFMRHIRYMAGKLVLDIAYGIKAKPENDEYIEIAEKGLEGLEKSGDKNIIDILPWVQHLPGWLPGMGWKRQVDECRRWSFAMRDTPFEYVKTQLVKGLAKPSLTTDLLETLEGRFPNLKTKESYIKTIAGTVYSAGSDTTISILNALILTMVMFPDIQQRAHAEIDLVIGPDRLPEFSDEGELPYITAIIKELLRWNVIQPFALPHSTASDDIYKGYYIPKGATVLGNAWAILNDPVAYPEPEVFNPDRFLMLNGKLDPNVQEPGVAFGFGRRICPGRFMAMDSMWITTACILAAFKIGRAVGPDGKEIIPSGEFQPGLVVHPLPFKCDIKPRSEQALTLIRASQERWA